MKVALLAESSSDVPGLFVLVTALAACPVEEDTNPPAIVGGVRNLLQQLPSFYRSRYYHSDADAFVVVLDSDDSPIHEKSHEPPGNPEPTCRLCQARLSVESIATTLPSRPAGKLLRLAFGLSVPAIEAWWLFAKDASVGEAAWRSQVKPGAGAARRRDLKRGVYGDVRVPAEMKRKRSREEAERLVADGKLPSLEAHFPGGFGALVRGIRSWPAPPGSP